MSDAGPSWPSCIYLFSGKIVDLLSLEKGASFAWGACSPGKNFEKRVKIVHSESYFEDFFLSFLNRLLFMVNYFIR